jgi:hypothetical protein
MANRKFYKITNEEFINVDLIISVKIIEEEVFISFINGEERSYMLPDLDTHFWNFMQLKLFL